MVEIASNRAILGFASIAGTNDTYSEGDVPDVPIPLVLTIHGIFTYLGVVEKGSNVPSQWPFEIPEWGHETALTRSLTNPEEVTQDPILVGQYYIHGLSGKGETRSDPQSPAKQPSTGCLDGWPTDGCLDGNPISGRQEAGSPVTLGCHLGYKKSTPSNFNTRWTTHWRFISTLKTKLNLTILFLPRAQQHEIDQKNASSRDRSWSAPGADHRSQTV